MTTARKKRARATTPPSPPPQTPQAAPEAVDPVAAAAAAGTARYVPQPPKRDLSGYGGSGSPAAGMAKATGDLLNPDTILKGFEPDDVLTDHQAIALYNDGITVEQFYKTPMGKKLQLYIEQDIQLFGEMAVSAPNGLGDPGVQSQFRLACAAHYVRDFLTDIVGKAIQAEQLLGQRDEESNNPTEPEG